MVERVIEEQAAGNPDLAAGIRARIGETIEEAFHRRVIVAVAGPDHGRHGADCEFIDMGL